MLWKAYLLLNMASFWVSIRLISGGLTLIIHCYNVEDRTQPIGLENSWHNMDWLMWGFLNENLGGDFKYVFLFTPTWQDSHLDYCIIFQGGWNHQLEMVCNDFLKISHPIPCVHLHLHLPKISRKCSQIYRSSHGSYVWLEAAELPRSSRAQKIPRFGADFVERNLSSPGKSWECKGAQCHVFPKK